MKKFFVPVVVVALTVILVLSVKARLKVTCDDVCTCGSGCWENESYFKDGCEATDYWCDNCHKKITIVEADEVSIADSSMCTCGKQYWECESYFTDDGSEVTDYWCSRCGCSITVYR